MRFVVAALGHRELPADQHPQHKPEFSDEFRRGELEGERGGRRGPWRITSSNSDRRVSVPCRPAPNICFGVLSFPGPPTWLSVRGDLRGEIGLESLLRSDDDVRDSLVVAASSVTDVDVVSGVALGLRAARHLRQRPDGTVSVLMPTAEPAAALLAELLPAEAEKLILVDGPPPPEQPRAVVLPATSVPDEGAAVAAAEYALEVCDALRISEARAAAAAQAVMELTDNSLHHADGAPDLPVVAATVGGRSRTVRVAVTDAGRALSESPDPGRLLGEIPNAKSGNGFLPTLLRKGDKFGFKVRIEILAGTARLRWKWSGRQVSGGLHLSGTTVVVTLEP